MVEGGGRDFGACWLDVRTLTFCQSQNDAQPSTAPISSAEGIQLRCPASGVQPNRPPKKPCRESGSGPTRPLLHFYLANSSPDKNTTPKIKKVANLTTSPHLHIYSPSAPPPPSALRRIRIRIRVRRAGGSASARLASLRGLRGHPAQWRPRAAELRRALKLPELEEARRARAGEAGCPTAQKGMGMPGKIRFPGTFWQLGCFAGPRVTRAACVSMQLTFVRLQ